MARCSRRRNRRPDLLYEAIGLFSDIVQIFGCAQKRQPGRTLLVDGNPAHLIEVDKLLPKRRELGFSLPPKYLRFQRMTAEYAALPAGKKYDGIRPLKPESQLALWIVEHPLRA